MGKGLPSIKDGKLIVLSTSIIILLAIMLIANKHAHTTNHTLPQTENVPLLNPSQKYLTQVLMVYLDELKKPASHAL